MRIGITGLAGSGKDTAAEMLSEMLGYEVVRFAQPLHDAARAIFGADALERDKKETPLPFDYLSAYSAVKPQNEALFERLFKGYEKLSPRQFMQTLGTEYFRAIDENYFINLVKNKEFIIVPDVRFENEAGIIDLLVCIKRDVAAVANHVSENFAKNVVAYEIDNNGSMAKLKKELQKMINAYKIGFLD